MVLPAGVLTMGQDWDGGRGGVLPPCAPLALTGGKCEVKVLKLAQQQLNLEFYFSMTVCSVLILLAVAVVGKALTPSTFLTTVDQQRLRSVFEGAVPYQDLQSAHYSILGIKLLGGTLPSSQVCHLGLYDVFLYGCLCFLWLVRMWLLV